MKKQLLLLGFICLAFLTRAQQTTIWSENFNTENLSNWTLIDADGDGLYFATTQMLGPNWEPIGTPFLYSLSYTQYMGMGNVFPDNWAITPAIDLSSVNPGETIKLNWAIVDSAYSWNPSPNNENYAVYIAESTDTNAFISGGIKYTEHDLPITYTVRTLDMSDYAGKTIYIAFRHYNVSDNIPVPFSSSLEFDDMSVVASTTTSVSQQKCPQELTVFPNPVKENLHLQIPDNYDSRNATLEIVDVTGKAILKFEANRDHFVVNSIPAGIYIAKVSNGKHTLISRFVKK